MKIYTSLITVLSVFSLLLEPTLSFGMTKPPLSSSYCRNTRGGTLWKNKEDDDACLKTLLELSADKNTKGGTDDDDDNDGSSALLSKIQKKDIPGVAFLSLLTLWHFWIGPALRTVILAARQQQQQQQQQQQPPI